MNILSNTIYNYSKSFTNVVLMTGMAVTSVNCTDLDLAQPLSSHILKQDFYSQSTSKSFLKNTLEISKSLEVENIKQVISNKFNSKVIDTWIPANGHFDKVCLFIALENQEDLSSQYANLELEIYKTLKLDIEKSQFFNMIALI